MDGLQIVKSIRRVLKQDIPIIIVSAYDYSEVEEEFLEAGADAFITKPLFKSKILHVLQTLINTEKSHVVSVPVQKTLPFFFCGTDVQKGGDTEGRGYIK